MGTTTEDIVQAVAAGATTAEDIERMTGAGTRCGHCRQEIAACLEEALAAKA
jgi:bacterioferritin-associated ferredoxin